MSAVQSFFATAVLALELKDRWREAVRLRSLRTATPSLLELQTICRETGISLPELDGFASVRDMPPMFLLCGGNTALATELAAIFGYHTNWAEPPVAPLIWCVSAGSKHSVLIRHSDSTQDISIKAFHTLLSKEWPSKEFLVVEETLKSEAPWAFCWIPHPEFMESPNGHPIETEYLLRQRAALVVSDSAPRPLIACLKDLNQKLWVAADSELSNPDEKRPIWEEIATVQEDRPEDLTVRITAAWRWLVSRLFIQIEDKRQQYGRQLSQFENKIAQARHLLEQYRTNWIGGVRAQVESHLQSRAGGSAFAPFMDTHKAGPQTDTFISSLALAGLWNKLDDYLTDRMADLVGGLGGLAAKIELRRIALGDANARWDMKSISSRLESALNEKKIFPSGGGRRSGLAANLTGRKHAVLDERKGQLAAGIRTVAQAIVGEFANWSSGLITVIENNIHLQLTAALVNQGLPDTDGMQAAQTGLNRLEDVLHSRHDAAANPDVNLAEFFKSLSRGGLIPLYHPV